MRLKQSTKILLGIVTIWPVAYMFLFFVGVVLLVFLLPSEASSTQPEPSASPLVPIGFLGFFAVHTLTIFLSMGLMAFYIVRVFKTEHLDQAMKIMWTVLICMVGIFAMPVFWYLYIWREPPVLAAGHSELPSASTSGINSPVDWSRRENEYNPGKPPDWR